MQFFNTAILLLIINANMNDNSLTFGIVGGSLKDFNWPWFKIVGNTIIGTMILNIVLPVIEHFTEKSIKTLERCMDRGCCPKDRYVTKTTSVAEYIHLYSGIDHMMHYGYSAFLIIVFVTFMFGFGIPILFPIATVAIFVLYRVELLALYYFYK